MVITKVIRHCLGICALLGSVYAASGESPSEKTWWRIGVGGVYGEYRPIDTKHTGGFFTIQFRDLVDNVKNVETFQFALDGRVGGSQGNEPFFFADFLIKSGINLSFSHTYPLYLNVLYNFERYYTDRKQATQMMRQLHQVGVELEGIIKSSERLRYEYSVGYDYIFSGFYRARADGAQTNLDGYNYGVRASLGFAYNLSESVHYYMKLKAKYYNLAQSGIYPHTQQYIGMLELGIGF